MILVGLGANLPSSEHGSPRGTLEAALQALAVEGVRIAARSRWYRSTALPLGDQPEFVNGVARVETMMGPGPLLERLHAIERRFGRERRVRWAPRVIDLDLLSYGDLVLGTPSEAPPRPGTALDGREPLILPHPRLHERAFVLLPLAEVAAGWIHPRLGASVEALIATLPPGQALAPFDDQDETGRRN